MTHRHRILVEGWRFSPNSLAVLNQFYCLEMLRRPDVELFFRDVPFHSPTWTQVPGLLPPEDEARLRALPAPATEDDLDASLRIAHPTLVTPTGARGGRSWCWIITEFGTLDQSRIADGRPVREALNTPGVRLITCSNWSRDGLTRAGADPANIALVPLGYDPRSYHTVDDARRADLRRQFGWEGRFVFLNISTMWWNKGIATLIPAFAATAEKHPDTLLVLKGNNRTVEPASDLGRAIASLPPQRQALVVPRLRYVGEYLTFQQVATFYQAADAYVAPYHGEGFNLPVLEAAACGLISICTAGGSTDEFTTPEFCRRIRSQLISPPQLTAQLGPGAHILQVDGDHLIELMRDTVTNESARALARTAAPAHVNPRYTWETVTGQLVRTLVSG
ncbi:MAG: glycosyltransferase family 4 protein [Phycisphaerales bacterium]